MQSVNISSAKAHLSSLLKKLEETELGDSFRVSVTMIVEQYGLKNIITKITLNNPLFFEFLNFLV